ncbi:MAG TPA: hypothetical protein VGC83_00725, partial [Solirubrobacteraceae bacterium]
ERGWQELSELLTDVLKRAQGIQERSDARRGDDADARTSEIVLMHFELAGPDDRPRRSLPPA